ncbi:hypothetical protein CR513_29480, partial [Mucuna pruriens]
MDSLKFLHAFQLRRCEIRDEGTNDVKRARKKFIDAGEYEICLNGTWQPKVTAIIESKDLSPMNLTSLFRKLQEHELELNKLPESKPESEEVGRFLKKKNKNGTLTQKKSTKKSESSQPIFTCYECVKQRHGLSHLAQDAATKWRQEI